MREENTNKENETSGRLALQPRRSLQERAPLGEITHLLLEKERKAPALKKRPSYVKSSQGRDSAEIKCIR